MENNVLISDLKKVLADSYALYLKTQNYHWNVEGPSFQSLHMLFETQYTDLAIAIDIAAELIRGLGVKAPGTWNQYEEISTIKDGNESFTADKMILDLIESQNMICETLQKALDTATKVNDDVIISFIVDRLTVHRKSKWMLSSSL